MSSRTLVGFAIKSCFDYLEVSALSSSLSGAGVPDFLAHSVVMDKVQPLALVGAAALDGSLPRELFRKALIAGNCPANRLDPLLLVYDEALLAYRDSVRSEGIDPDSLPKVVLTEEQIDTVIKNFHSRAVLGFKMKKIKVDDMEATVGPLAGITPEHFPTTES